MCTAFADLQMLISELRENPYIELQSAELAPGEGVDYVREVVRQNGLEPSNDYLRFFGSVGYVDIRWQLRDRIIELFGLRDSPYVNGAIYIPPFETVLSDRQLDSYWLNIAWRTYENGGSGVTSPPLLPVDYTSRDISACSCCGLKDNAIIQNMYYFDHQTGILPLAITLEKYARSLRSNRGIFGWQKAKFRPAERAREDLTAVLQKVFG